VDGRTRTGALASAISSNRSEDQTKCAASFALIELSLEKVPATRKDQFVVIDSWNENANEISFTCDSFCFPLTQRDDEARDLRNFLSPQQQKFCMEKKKAFRKNFSDGFRLLPCRVYLSWVVSKHMACNYEWNLDIISGFYDSKRCGFSFFVDAIVSTGDLNGDQLSITIDGTQPPFSGFLNVKTGFLQFQAVQGSLNETCSGVLQVTEPNLAFTAFCRVQRPGFLAFQDFTYVCSSGPCRGSRNKQLLLQRLNEWNLF